MKAGPSKGWPTSFANTCPCGKRSYHTKKLAKAARKNHGRDLRAYRCPEFDGWHLGHLPDDIRHGDVDRQTVFGGR